MNDMDEPPTDDLTAELETLRDLFLRSAARKLARTIPEGDED